MLYLLRMIRVCLLLLLCGVPASLAQSEKACPETDSVSMALCQTLGERNRPETFFAIRLQASREESYLLAQLLGLPLYYQRSLDNGEAAEESEVRSAVAADESASEGVSSLFYFGSFKSAAEARDYLRGAERQLRSDFQAYKPSFHPLSRIDGEYFEFELQLRGGQLVARESTLPVNMAASRNSSVLQVDKPVAVAAGPMAAESVLPATTSVSTRQLARSIYSIQLVSFKGPQGYRRFVDRYDSLELYCRRKQNGLYAVSLRQFSAYDSAKQSLQKLLQGNEKEAKVLRRLGAYVVKLPAASVQPCDTQASLVSRAD